MSPVGQLLRGHVLNGAGERARLGNKRRGLIIRERANANVQHARSSPLRLFLNQNSFRL